MEKRDEWSGLRSTAKREAESARIGCDYVANATENMITITLESAKKQRRIVHKVIYTT
jgi:hypothetical protein